MCSCHWRVLAVWLSCLLSSSVRKVAAHADRSDLAGTSIEAMWQEEERVTQFLSKMGIRPQFWGKYAREEESEELNPVAVRTLEQEKQSEASTVERAANGAKSALADVKTRLEGRKRQSQKSNAQALSTSIEMMPPGALSQGDTAVSRSTEKSALRTLTFRTGDMLNSRYKLMEQLVEDHADDLSETLAAQEAIAEDDPAPSNSEDSPSSSSSKATLAGRTAFQSISDHYDIDDSNGKLGAGAFGEVWLARDLSHGGRQLVVKLFKEKGKYVWGAQKADFDEERTRSSAQSSRPESAQSSGAPSETLSDALTERQARHIDDLALECDIARLVQKGDPGSNAVLPYRKRFTECYEKSITERNLPVYIALGFGGKRSITRYIDKLYEKLDEASTLSGFIQAGQRQKSPAQQKRVVVYDLFKQFLQGLTLLHNLGITHHDLKVSNIVVNDDGQISFIDYGAMTKWGSQCSTVHTWSYVPPDFLKKPKSQKRTCDGTFDIYSASVILYNMVQRQPDRDPFLAMICKEYEFKCNLQKNATSGEYAGLTKRRLKAHNILETARSSSEGLLNHDIKDGKTFKDSIREEFLEDSDFAGFLGRFWTQALHPEPDKRPSAQEVLESDDWFAPFAAQTL